MNDRGRSRCAFRQARVGSTSRWTDTGSRLSLARSSGTSGQRVASSSMSDSTRAGDLTRMAISAPLSPQKRQWERSPHQQPRDASKGRAIGSPSGSRPRAMRSRA